MIGWFLVASVAAAEENRAWFLGSPIDIGVGIQDQSKSGKGLFFKYNFGRIALGYDSVSGLGIGTAVYEGWMIDNTRAFEEATSGSFFPVYLYYPLLMRKNKLYGESWDRKSTIHLQGRCPSVMLFAGGSLWCATSNYAHFGISSVFFQRVYLNPYDPNEPGSHRSLDNLFHVWTLGIDAGIYFKSDYLTEHHVHSVDTYKLSGDTGFYITIILGVGGLFDR